MEKHTQTLLRAGGTFLYTAGEESVPLGKAFNKADGVDVSYERSVEDVRRLAAAWNAVIDLPTATLEAGVVAELVGACEKAERYLDPALVRPQSLTLQMEMRDEALDALRAALAKAKGT